MAAIIKLVKKLVQPGLYNLTKDIELLLLNKILDSKRINGILHLFCMHTSCALLINEAWDDSAKRDLERFFNYLAPTNLPFIEHSMEGEDDSPAHMKSALLHQNLAVIVEQGKLVLGKWQGIFLAEFRKREQERTILLKFQPDQNYE